MEWKLIDKNNLPKGEVLAANFNSGTFGHKDKLIGTLYVNGAGNVTCDADDTIFNDCTHYADVNNNNPQ